MEKTLKYSTIEVRDSMERKINYRAIGDKIRIEREKFDISREKFAELLELSPFFIGQIERGERKMSISTLISVSECLHVSIDYLIFGEIHDIQNHNSLQDLINKCSEKEAKVIEEITKAILPHIVR